MRYDIKKILINSNKEGNGIPAVYSGDFQEVLSDSYLLKDISLLIISLYKNNDLRDVNELLEKLGQFKDSDSGFYFDSIDISGIKNALSSVRNISSQASAVVAEAILEKVKDNPFSVGKYLEKLEFLINTYIENGLKETFSNHFAYPLSNEITIDSVSNLTIAYYHLLTLGPDTVDKSDTILKLYRVLMKFWNGQSFHTHVTSEFKPDISAGYSLKSTLLLIESLICLHHSGVPCLKSKIHSEIERLGDFKTKDKGGFWNRISFSRVVEVDPVSFTYNKVSSPFPVKLTEDHANLIALLSEYRDMTNGNHMVTVDRYIDIAIKELQNFHDARHDGFFMGLGFWFSTPHDATVPLARIVMSQRNALGGVNIGNTRYIPLNQKQTSTQIACYNALSKVNIPEDSKPSKENSIQYDWKKIDISRNVSSITKAALSDDVIDIPRYVKWLQGTQAGFGYGLTPYKSPASLRSDTTPQTFSALHVMADFAVLGNDRFNKNNVLESIRATQNSDGGFSESPGMPSEVFTTYCAVLTNRILNEQHYDIDKCIDFLLNCLNTDGGFGNYPGYPSDIWHTNLAILSLVSLNVELPNLRQSLDFIARCQNPDGGYAFIPDMASDTFSVFRAVGSLLSLGYEPPQYEKTVAWLKRMQASDGGFRFMEGRVTSFVGSYHAIAALYILDSQPDDAEKCIQYIASRQASDGGFSRMVGTPSETTDEGFIAIHALHMLENKLNKYWAISIT